MIRPRRKQIDPAMRLYVLHLRDPKRTKGSARGKRTRDAYKRVFGVDLNTQDVIEAFEQYVEDAIPIDDPIVELPTKLAEAVAVLLKAAPYSSKPRIWREEKLTRRAAINTARALRREGEKEAHEKLAERLKKPGLGTVIKDGMSRRRKYPPG